MGKRKAAKIASSSASVAISTSSLGSCIGSIPLFMASTNRELDNALEQTLFGSVADLLDDPSSLSTKAPPKKKAKQTSDSSEIPAGASSSSSSSTKKRRVNPKRDDDDGQKKSFRVDYREPEHRARLDNAIDEVTVALGHDPNAFHRLVTDIARNYTLPYNTLRDNFLRSKGIEPRAHRPSEKQRLLDKQRELEERGGPDSSRSVIKDPTLKVMTVPVHMHIAEMLGKAKPEERFLKPVSSVLARPSSSSSSSSSSFSSSSSSDIVNPPSSTGMVLKEESGAAASLPVVDDDNDASTSRTVHKGASLAVDSDSGDD